jgi:hypothetical protein
MGVAALALPAASVASPTAVIAKKCPHSAAKGRSFGPTYVTNVTANGVACGKARKLIKAYHSAGAGNRTVNGYSCKQKRLATSPFQYDDSVTCTKGDKKVTHIYTQNT